MPRTSTHGLHEQVVGHLKAAGAADAEQQAADFVERVRDRPGKHAPGQRREAVGRDLILRKLKLHT